MEPGAAFQPWGEGLSGSCGPFATEVLPPSPLPPPPLTHSSPLAHFPYPSPTTPSASPLSLHSPPPATALGLLTLCLDSAEARRICASSAHLADLEWGAGASLRWWRPASRALFQGCRPPATHGPEGPPPLPPRQEGAGSPLGCACLLREVVAEAASRSDQVRSEVLLWGVARSIWVFAPPPGPLLMGRRRAESLKCRNPPEGRGSPVVGFKTNCERPARRKAAWSEAGQCCGGWARAAFRPSVLLAWPPEPVQSAWQKAGVGEWNQWSLRQESLDSPCPAPADLVSRGGFQSLKRTHGSGAMTSPSPGGAGLVLPCRGLSPAGHGGISRDGGKPGPSTVESRPGVSGRALQAAVWWLEGRPPWPRSGGLLLSPEAS